MNLHEYQAKQLLASYGLPVPQGQVAASVQEAVEAFFKVVKNSMVNGENVYVRGFGSFVVKKRAKKTARNISKNTAIIIPEHFVPSFKPAKVFVEKVKSGNKS